MRITEHDVLYVGGLANLELTADERARMLQDMNSILDYVDLLNQLDTSDVEPMAQVSDRHTVPTREDRTGTSLDHDAVMKNAPETDGTFFKVPKVIEK